MDCIVRGVAKSQTRLSNFHSLSLPETSFFLDSLWDGSLDTENLKGTKAFF